jgi:hypothetical protein
VRIAASWPTQAWFVGDDRLFQPAKIAAAKKHNNEAPRTAWLSRDGLAVASMCGRLAASQPPATAILRRWRSVRFGIVDQRRIVSFDADDRENDDCGGLFGRVNTAEAHDAPLVRKLDNGAHFGGPAVVRFLPGSGHP